MKLLNESKNRFESLIDPFEKDLMFLALKLIFFYFFGMAVILIIADVFSIEWKVNFAQMLAENATNFALVVLTVGLGNETCKVFMSILKKIVKRLRGKYDQNCIYGAGDWDECTYWGEAGSDCPCEKWVTTKDGKYVRKVATSEDDS